MSQRTVAGLLAFVLTVALWAVAGFTPLPYVTYRPGPTVDILAEQQGRPTVRVSGHRAYRDEGELSLTTVYVSQPEDRITLPELVRAYFSDDAAVYPRSAVYSPDETDESSDQMSAIQMVSSQDNATAVALDALDYDVPTRVEVLKVIEDMPAEGRLRVGDEILTVGFTEIKRPEDVVEAVGVVKAGEPLAFRIRRKGRERNVVVTPVDDDGHARIGIVPGTVHDFPFDVQVDITDNIGGPSAGLMMALAVYDTLTPGSLTGGAHVSGTGTISPEGEVGPIGGVQQKVAGARETGADLFLVPAGNCNEVGDVDTDDMRLVKAATMTEALDAIETWRDDPDATLPTCEDEAP